MEAGSFFIFQTLNESETWNKNESPSSKQVIHSLSQDCVMISI